jgi:thiosulfate dehydrogenase (quinone) large subunit
MTTTQGAPPAAARNVPVAGSAQAPAPTGGGVTLKVAAVLRVVMGLVFGWAFLDKVFGWGYSTSSANAWVNGGSPTKGFLGSIDHGPFASTFQDIAGAAWADWLFMLGLAGIAIALVTGAGMRIAAITGGVLLLFMWVAEWPLDRHTSAGELTRSTNPIIDDHLIYAIILVLLAALNAGIVWGVGKRWANLGFVRANRWLM